MKKFSFALLIVFLFVLLIGSSAYAEKIRVAVADFVNREPKMDSAQSFYFLKHIAEEFTKILDSYSDKIDAVSSKSLQTLNALTPKSLASVAKSEGCKYIVLGALTKFDVNSYVSYKSNSLIPTMDAQTSVYTVTFDVRVIEADTGKVVFSSSGTGQRSYRQTIENAKKIAASKEVQQEAIKESESIFNSTYSSASSMAAEKVYTFLTGEYPEIISLKANTAKKKKSKTKSKKEKAKVESLGTVNINYGSKSGITEESFYRVFYEGEEIFDFTGNSLGCEKFNLAIARVSNVKDDYCTAEVIGGIFSNIRNGDKAERITSDEAQLIIDENDFVKNRLSEFLR